MSRGSGAVFFHTFEQIGIIASGQTAVTGNHYITEFFASGLCRVHRTEIRIIYSNILQVCSEIVEIDNRQIYQYKGNYSYYLEKRQERIEAKTVEIERANNLYRTELEWMRRMPQARGHKARYREDAFYELEKVAKQRFNNDNVKLDACHFLSF